MAEQKAVKTGDRLAFIDWTRGLAAVIMLQGHTFHSFTRPDLRDKSPYTLSQFAGGLPPAIFLLLTGITFVLAFQLISLGVVAAQAKRYFEELYHLGTTVLRRTPRPAPSPTPDTED